MRIHRCSECGFYTLEDSCPSCGSEARGTRPPRFSPEDRYGKYRRRMKKAEGLREKCCKT
ncbi:MAG: RNA-protein complex protein Nop10 [Candidatus Altiarchaeota archaeon]|nr:RNA-protein complex protein Nop10 [Candidatus Altiarchaeota archaeon]